MGLPCDLLTLLAERNRAKTKQRIKSHPSREEEQKTWVPKCRHQRQSRHPIGLTIARAVPPRFEGTARLKDKTHDRRHGSGNCRRGADHGPLGTWVADKICQGTSSGRYQHEDHVAPGAETPRECRPKRDQPREIKPDVQ